MLKTLAIVVPVALAALLAYAATRPDTFRIQREIRIKAPSEKVFAALNDFHRWSAWSPWEKLDPAMKRIHSGAASGPGAVYEWEGNGKVGMGRMEIVESAAPSKLVVKLDFLKPFEAHNTAEYTLQTEGDTTHVTWAMFGPTPFVSKLMQVFISMERMVGKDFETGLANLKTVAEQP